MSRSTGYFAHVEWERERGDENECARESIISSREKSMSAEWWKGWFERSDEWRDEQEEKGGKG